MAAIGIAHHEPLADAAAGVTDHQRDAAKQRAHGGDAGVAAGQLVAAVEHLATQVEDLHLGALAEGIQPLLAGFQLQGHDRFAQRRQVVALLAEAHLAGEQVLFSLQAQGAQLATGDRRQLQAGAIDADGQFFQGAALGVQRNGLGAERVDQLGTDGLHAAGVAETVFVLRDQGAAIVKADHEAAAAGGVFTQRDDAPAFRQRQARFAEQRTRVHIHELHLATGVQTHGDLVLFLDGQQQGRLTLGQPARALFLRGAQFGALEDRQHHVGQVEEDQGDRTQHRQATDGDVPAGQAILEGAHAPLALEGRRIEVQPRRPGRSAHVVFSHIVHELHPGPARRGPSAL